MKMGKAKWEGEDGTTAMKACSGGDADAVCEKETAQWRPRAAAARKDGSELLLATTARRR
ncbi:oxalate:formate antiporter [Sesbania bispinosa]|nr:oxalate:formate antiporter [Sesbania bispinosa]